MEKKFVAAGLLLLATGAGAAGFPPGLYDLAPGSVTITYKVTHPMHHIEGVCHAAQGKAKVLPDGSAEVMVRARVADFDSGNGNRDEHMKETVDAVHFPYVIFKGRLQALAAGEAPVQGEVQFHGVTRPVQLTAHIAANGAGALHVTGDLHLTLTEFRIERPSLLFIPVHDRLPIHFDATFAPEAASAAQR